MAPRFTVDQVNSLGGTEFERIFGNVVEHYPAAASALCKLRPFKDAYEISQGADDFLNSLNFESKKRILKLFPNLAGKLAEDGKLTKESDNEHKSAGLDKLSNEEKLELGDLNRRYMEKFDFPFVICARQNKVPAIFSGLKKRLDNEIDHEITNGIEEVKKICALRIYEIVQ